MVGYIVDLLNIDDYYGISKEIDIAKGINKMPQTFKEGWERRKRIKAWQRT